MSSSIDESIKKYILTTVNKHLPKCKVYLFGSRALKTNSPRSDIDIALDAEKEIPINITESIKEEFENSSIIYTIDLLDLHAVQKRMKEHILSHGVVWQ